MLRSEQAPLWIAAGNIGLMFAGSTLLTPLYELYRQTFGFSALMLTLIYSAYVVGNLFSLLVLGRLSDQLGRRAVALAGLVIAVAATAVFLAAASTPWLFAGRIVSGVAIALGSTAATAWLAELTPDRRRASVFATAGNFSGLAVGALLAGLLASFAPWKLRLSFLAYLVLLVAMGFLVARLPETAEHRVSAVREVSLKPRIGVPRELLGRFIAPAAICFATFAVFGYYAALIPSLLSHALRLDSPAVGGAVVALLCAVGATVGVLLQTLSSRTAMLAGSALMVPAVALLPAAEALHSLAVLLIGTVLAGGATILAFRGSLQVVNEMAPSERRGEVIATYILFSYAGNSVPIVGEGFLRTITTSLTADIAFAAVIILLSLLGLAGGAKWLPKPER